MSEEALPTSLQESLLALLAFNDAAGAAVAVQLKSEHFDQPFQKIASVLLGYRRENGRPPGYTHLDDVFGFDLQRGEQSAPLRRRLAAIADLAPGLNGDYLVGRVSHFIADQTFKTALIRAGEAYQTGGEDKLERAQQIIHAAMRASVSKLDAGTSLGDPNRALRFLDYSPPTYMTGIKELDDIGFGATAGQLLLYIGPKGTGKSWFCVHMGRQGLIHRGKVLHISLEMDEELVIGRYFQSVCSASLRAEPYVLPVFEFDDLNRLSGIKKGRKRKPKLSFSDPDIRQVLLKHLHKWGLRYGSIIVKRFPSGGLTIPQLVSYLDWLEAAEKFIPTMVIIDYPDLMKLDARNLRLDLGRTFVELRGLAISRDFALVAPTQGSRSGMTARRVRSTHTAEDISKVFTADNVLTYSRTPAEELYGVARLYLNHARNMRGNLEIVITQAYAVGQFALQSAMSTSMYWEQLKLAEAESDGDSNEID